MASTGDLRFTPPSAPVADVEPVATGAVLASRWRRLGVAIFDSLLIIVVLGLVLLPLGINPFTLAARYPLQYRVLGTGVGFGLFLALHGYLLVTSGQTIGKRLFGLRIVRRDGSTVSAFRILGRYVPGVALNMIPGVGGLYGFVDSLLIFRESRRCLHDQIADTIVIRV